MNNTPPAGGLEHLRLKCRAGILLERARCCVYEFSDPRDDVRPALLILDRLAGELRFEVASVLGAGYDLFWNDCEDIDLWQ